MESPKHIIVRYLPTPPQPLWCLYLDERDVWVVSSVVALAEVRTTEANDEDELPLSYLSIRPILVDQLSDQLSSFTEGDSLGLVAADSEWSLFTDRASAGEESQRLRDRRLR